LRFDDAGNVIETHGHAGEFKEWQSLFRLARETAGATTRLDMQWLQPPSTPEANGFIQILSAFNYGFFRR
jgi:hypothetical protein